MQVSGDAVPGMCDDEPGDVTWVRGVDYLKGWREAREAARDWNDALCSAGFSASDLRAVAGTGDGGEGVVRFRGSPVGVQRAAWLLRLGAGTLTARRERVGPEPTDRAPWLRGRL